MSSFLFGACRAVFLWNVCIDRYYSNREGLPRWVSADSAPFAASDKSRYFKTISRVVFLFGLSFTNSFPWQEPQPFR